ncbi:hypothetical protein [Nocardioides jiangxiensis]|uniref:Phage integrase family protein n=1 Tax=Nocardioides jiangxiensis TaxID=3064524 RepID=A0ABT9B190_9ACTN|nr:hypothetical protein [Nocardioides sp. WY-20]MDO7868170.1 hypothetical protein [Nocardioides sp. WY-20]
MARERRIGDLVSPERADRAHVEAAAYTAFQSRFNLDDSAEAVVLYLAGLHTGDLPSRTIRDRLTYIDLDRRLRGLRPWNQDPDVKVFLKGLFSERPVGDGKTHYAPLYLELTHALVDAARTPSDDQRRGEAALMLRTRLKMTNIAICRLKWSDVWLGKDRVEITETRRMGVGEARRITHRLNSERGSATCPVAMIRVLRSVGGGEYVLGIDGRQYVANRLARLLAQPDPSAPYPAQIRDPALMLMAYGAGMRTAEASTLRQRDVERHDKGLVISIDGRKRLTFLPSAPDPAYDPALAWEDWLDVLEERGLRAPDGLAFMPSNHAVVYPKPLRSNALNRIVHDRTEEAGLDGRYVFISLRAGMIRTALRNDAKSYAIASHADLVTLGAVARHERRENLLGDGNVAGRLGL